MLVEERLAIPVPHISKNFVGYSFFSTFLTILVTLKSSSFNDQRNKSLTLILGMANFFSTNGAKVVIYQQPALDALDKKTQEVAESCAHLMPLQDKTSVMASSVTEFQWLTGKRTCPDSLGL